MRGQHDLPHHLVELHVLDIGQRVVLPVDGTGLQPGIDLSVGHGRRVGTERTSQQLPCVAARHAQFDARQVGRHVDLLLRFESDLACAEEDRSEDLHLDLVFDHLLHLGAHVAAEEGRQMVCIAEQIGRGQQCPGRNLLGDVLRSDVAHFEVVTLQCHQLGTLFEQRGVEVRLDLEVGRDGLGELLHHFSANVLVREHGGKTQGGLRLCPGRQHRRGGERSAQIEGGTAAEVGVHGTGLLCCG